MRILFKMVLAPISLFVAFLALMAKWLLTLSSYIVAPLMLYIFGCGIYTVYRQTWDQFLILLVAEFLCFVLFVGATAMVEGVERFSGWLRDYLILNLLPPSGGFFVEGGICSGRYSSDCTASAQREIYRRLPKRPH